MVSRRKLANHFLVGGTLHLSEIFDKIKTEFVKSS